MKESQIKEHLNKGWIRALMTFEVVGKPAKHVEDSLKQYMENIKKDHRIIILHEEREEVIEHEDGMFSTFSEAEMLVQDLETFTWLVINFSPASIEVLDPDALQIPARDLTNWFNDLLARTHEIASNHRTQISATQNLTVAMNQLIKNAILLSLRHESRTEKEIEHDTGIYAEQLEPFLKHLIDKAEILQKGDKYSLVK